MKDFFKEEKDRLVLLALVFAFVVIPNWITITRAELLIALFAALTIYRIGGIERRLEDIELQMSRMNTRLDNSERDLHSSNPVSKSSVEQEEVKSPYQETARKAAITGGLIGAIIVGLIGASLGFLLARLSGALICGIIGAAIGDQIQRNQRRRSNH